MSRVEEFLNGPTERRVLAALVTDKVTLARVVPHWDGRLFESPWANVVAGWCVDYYRRCGAAPGRDVESLYESWSETHPDEATVKLVDQFLRETSGEHDRDGVRNSEYLIDLSGKHFNTVRLTRLAESVQANISAGKLARAEQQVTEYRRAELGAGAGIDVFTDREVLDSAFTGDYAHPLVEYGGGLRKFLGNTLCREGFVAFCAPEKTGKSWWLLDIALSAVEQGRRVAFFECGDMGLSSVIRRIAVRLTGIPFTSPDGRWPYTVRVPTSIQRPDKGELAPVEYEDQTFDQAITRDEAWAAFEDYQRRTVRSNQSRFKLSCHANFSVSVPAIRSVLDSWIQSGWIPDVVVIDYADILELPKGKERRDQINDSWMLLRRLSQELHVLVVTATQANRESYSQTSIDRRHVSEEKRKLAHVTAMISINMTGKEKEAQVYRLGHMVRREGDYKPLKHVYCASCLALARPVVVSVF